MFRRDTFTRTTARKQNERTTRTDKQHKTLCMRTGATLETEDKSESHPSDKPVFATAAAAIVVIAVILGVLAAASVVARGRCGWPKKNGRCRWQLALSAFAVVTCTGRRQCGRDPGPSSVWPRSGTAGRPGWPHWDDWPRATTDLEFIHHGRRDAPARLCVCVYRARFPLTVPTTNDWPTNG